MAMAQPVPPRPRVFGTPHGTPGPNSAGPVSIVNAVRSGTVPTMPPQVRTFPTMAAAQAAISPGNILLGVLYEHTPAGGRALAIYGPDCNETGVADLGVAQFANTAEAIDTICPGAMLYQSKDWNMKAMPQDAMFFEVQNGRNDKVARLGKDTIRWVSSIRFYPYYPIPPYSTD